MSTKIASTFLSVAAVALALAASSPAAGQSPAKDGPPLGKWEFTGKDNAGRLWSGTLTIAKLDPARFDVKNFHSMCILELESNDPSLGTKGVEETAEWNPATRAFTIGNTTPAINVYTAILSADGKALTQGKWTESKMVRGQVAGVVRSGQWSAKLAKQ